MSEDLLLALLSGGLGGIGILTSVLLGMIVHELRQLRQEIKTCVPDAMCHVMMSAQADRIRKIEQLLERSSR